MAKISNKTAYPQQSPVALSDYLIGTDGATLATKTFTVQSLANIIDDNVSLQEVLNHGNSAYYNGASIPAQEGTMILGTTNGVGLQQDTLTFNGQTGDVTMVAGLGVVPSTANLTVDGDVKLNTASSDLILSGGIVTAIVGQDVKITAAGSEDIKLATSLGGNITLNGAGTADFSVVMGGVLDFNITSSISMSSQTQTLTSAGQAVFSSSGGDTIIGADDTLYIGQTTGIYEPTDIVIHGSQSITMSTDTATTNFKLNGSIPQIESNSPHYFDSEIRLQGQSAGTPGQIMRSNGPGNNPLWIDDSALSPHQLSTLVFNATGVAMAKGAPVKIASNPSGTPQVILADSTTAANQLPCAGLLAEQLPNATEGEAITCGILQNITVAFTGTVPQVGDLVYVSNTAGELTVDRPSGSTEGVQSVGIITKDTTQIDILVLNPGRPAELPNLPAKSMFIGSSQVGQVGKAVSTSLISIDDSSPALPNFDMIIGDVPTTIEINGRHRSNVTHVYGENNVAYGENTMGVVGMTGTQNTAVGFNAMNAIDNGEANVAVGESAMSSAVGSSSMVAIGLNALTSSTAGQENVAVGTSSQGNSVDSIRNTSLGHEALRNVTGNTNNQNVAIGWNSADALTAGEKNVIVGAQGLGNQVNASSFNTVIGESAGGNVNIVTGFNQSVLVGFEAGWNATDDRTTAIGYQAGRANAGAANVWIGRSSGVLNTGNGNTFVGSQVASISTTADTSTIVGSGAGAAITIGAENTILGERGAQTLDTGNNNIIIGKGADVNDPTANNATIVGHTAIGGENQTVIGQGANANHPDQVIIGAGATSAGIAAAYLAFSNALGASYAANTPLLQAPDNAGAAAIGLPIGAVYVVGPTGGAPADPAIMAIRTL